MNTEFEINPEWITAEHGSEEIRLTSAYLQIKIGNSIATRIEDDWSRSTNIKVRLSAYPLALWFASSWWRLRWEPAREVRSLDWKMAHETAAAGYGYLWPRLIFEPDGRDVDVICRRTDPASTEPIRYLDSFRHTVSGDVFERAIDDFISLVISRLDAVGLANTELHALWREVADERRDKDSFFYRKLEACLGYDPDEAPEQVVNRLIALAPEAGNAAITEIAPLCSGKEPHLQQVIDLSRKEGVRGEIVPPEQIKKLLGQPSFRQSRPWEQGCQLAYEARKAWGLNDEAIADAHLSDLLHVPASSFREPDSQNPLLGLAIREQGSARLNMIFRRGNRLGRRFEAARFMAEQFTAPANDRWLPQTDYKTARQKLQRAFAAEFLCPIDALLEYMGNDFADAKMEDAGEHFGVSSLAIRSHLVNNDILPFDVMDIDSCRSVA